MFSPAIPEVKRSESAEFSCQHDSLLETSVYEDNPTKTTFADTTKPKTILADVSCQARPASQDVGVQWGGTVRHAEQGCQTAAVAGINNV